MNKVDQPTIAAFSKDSKFIAVTWNFIGKKIYKLYVQCNGRIGNVESINAI